MKKVCIISTVEFSRMTMLSLYTDYFKAKKIEYDIVCVRKDGVNFDENASNIYEFDGNKTKNKGKIQKLLHFFSMRKLVKKTFDENEYSFVVVWNQVTTFLFYDYLKKYYNKKYCINIRDYHYDDKPIIRRRLKSAINHAAFTTVSSDAFKSFLPESEYLMIHSLNMSLLESLERHIKKAAGEKIRILNIGQIRWCENNIFPLIDALANDNRFEMYFVGVGSEKVDQYIAGKNITNVYTHGRFRPEETSSFLSNADIIFNLYGYGNLHVDTALSIKLYYAVYLGIPILTYAGTHMNEVAKRIGIALTVNQGDFADIGEKIYAMYNDIDEKRTRSNCDAFIREIMISHQTLNNLLDRNVQNI